MALKLRPDGILDPEGRYPNPFTGEPYSDKYKQEAYNLNDKGENKGWSGLKTYQDRFDILRRIHNYQFTLLIATTGVGKTVVVPKLLAHYFGYEKAIICTTPRQATTLDAGSYSALCADVPLTWKDPITGETKKREKDFYVGLRYGAEKEKDDKATKLLFATDGTIKSMMMRTNPNLDGYYGILIDEAHERSTNIDILIGLIVDLCKRRPEFRVILMSATVNEEVFIQYFNRLGMGHKFNLYMPEGVKTTFNLETLYSPKPVTTMKVVEEVQKKIDAILSDPVEMEKLMGPGNMSVKGRFFKYGRDILGFVTSANECAKIKQTIDRNWAEGKYKYHPYTIVLTRDTEEWLANIAKKPNGLSLIPADGQKYDLKVIISTPVAESSTTFGDPMAWVVDGGMANYVWFDPVNYGTKQFKDLVAKANIKQRCGRTGRNNDGICYKVYSEQQWNALAGFPDPEIMHKDITEDLLSLILLPHIGDINKLLEFVGNMVEPPQNYKDGLKVGLRNLLDYDFVDIYGRPTALGKLCSGFGKAGMYIARLLIIGYYLGIFKEVLFLGAILNSCASYTDMFFTPKGKEEDPELKERFIKILGQFTHPAGDHLTMVNLYLQWVEQPEYIKPYWEKQYMINRKKMETITSGIQELAQSALQNIKEITALNLIKIYPSKQAGGGGIAAQFPTNADGDMYIPAVGTDEFAEMALSIRDNINGSAGTHQIGGGLDTRVWMNTRDEAIGGQLGCGEAMADHLAVKQCINRLRADCPLIPVAFQTGGGTSFEKTNEHMNQIGSGPSKGKGNKKAAPVNQEERERREKIKRDVEQRETKLRDYINSPGMSLRGLFVNTIESPVDLGDVYKLGLAERIMMALYFAYHTQLAIYDADPSDKSYSYIPKYSPIKGTLKDSSLKETLKIRPNFVLYNTFSISEEMGNKLSIASHMPDNILKLFQDAKARLK
jgi:HrpA-like RNA helicase